MLTEKRPNQLRIDPVKTSANMQLRIVPNNSPPLWESMAQSLSLFLIKLYVMKSIISPKSVSDVWDITAIRQKYQVLQIDRSRMCLRIRDEQRYILIH